VGAELAASVRLTSDPERAALFAEPFVLLTDITTSGSRTSILNLA
jgi:hypothetical protein